MAATGTPSFTLTPELRRTSSVVVLGMIMSILDTTIVAVALATLGRDFHVSVTTIQWVSTGYLLALATVIPVSGWAVDRFGAKLIWMTSLTLFVIGSSLCGLAWFFVFLFFLRSIVLAMGESGLGRLLGRRSRGRIAPAPPLRAERAPVAPDRARSLQAHLGIAYRKLQDARVVSRCEVWHVGPLDRTVRA